MRWMQSLANPLAMKVGPNSCPQKLIAHLRDQPRRTAPVTLICRMGVRQVGAKLKHLIECVQAAKIEVVWCIDPMHGNTYPSLGRKWRRLSDICEELEWAIDLLQTHGCRISGLHLETTQDSVQECLNPGESEQHHYRTTTLCDPRLNPSQTQRVLGVLKRCKRSLG